MDLPIDLQSKEFVKGSDELHQVIILVLKSAKGQLLQDPDWGAGGMIHIEDKDDAESLIKNEVEKIKGVTVETCKFLTDEEVIMQINYRGQIVSYQFAV